MIQFPCPHCSAKLRLQDRGLRGRTVDCPDCGRPVLLHETPEGITGTLPAAAPSVETSAQGSTPFPARYGIWGAAAAAFLLILAWILWPSPPTTSPPDDQIGEESASDTPPVPGPPPQPPPLAPVPAPEAVPERTIAEQHLARLGQDLWKFSNQRGQYPTASTTGLSWIGELQRLAPNSPAYQPERPWDDTINDLFVRRRLEALQNPRVPQLVGEDGYPATHFAGVSGVGGDAFNLPVKHPRAGIFGHNRVVTPDDVKDGLANTVMVVGVSQRLGSWAAPGGATMRSFAQEPYVNGPDGMGTGEIDGMHVLMADGSVRFLSADTAPVIWRRLAAMADGLALDPRQPGDPLAMQPPENFVPPPVVVLPEDIPLLVELAPEPPPFNVQLALSQRLIRFEQTRPLPLKSLLNQWSELAGLPVDISLVPPDKLLNEQRHDLSDITLQQLLDSLLVPAGLVAEYDDRFGVKLQPAAADN